ncbi:ATP-binding protein [Metapseudomonas otitidis]|uniref:ATP-binding protein n=1 Tax=Metapseudomonas otitidis TaxID=319939 RepID=UPI004055385F
MQNSAQEKTYRANFTVDAALLRELGERLVGKPHIALAELVKNSYDADATEVIIRFGQGKIIVIDNGDGMSPDAFINYWLRVGTTHKQDAELTGRKRQVTGSKGVGRLSVQFLGDNVRVESRGKDQSRQFSALVDWGEAHKSGDLLEAGADVTDTDQLTLLDGKYPHGTMVEIGGLKKKWYVSDLQELAKELWFLKPPKDLLEIENTDAVPDVFDVRLEGVTENALVAFSEQMNQALKNWIATIEGRLLNGKEGGENEVTVTFRDGDTYSAHFKPQGRYLEQAQFKIFVFKLSGKQSGGIQVSDARNYFKKFGGVHIYDNGFRLPFYGGEEQDWLQLEMAHSHRLNRSYLLPPNLQVKSGLNDLPTNGRIFGVVKISTSLERQKASEADLSSGRYLNVQVTRDRLIDNEAFEELQHSVRWAIDFYAMRSYEKRQRKIASERLEVPRTEEKVSEIRQELFKIALSAPTELVPKLDAVSTKFEQLEALELQRTTAFEEERILLAALATTGMAAIAMEHELAKELSLLDEIRDELNGGAHIADQPRLLESLNAWAERTSSARKLFSPVMHETDREKRVEFNAKKTISRIIANSSVLLRQVEVVNEVPNDLKLPPATFAAWNSIFQNALINSVNAMLDSSVRQIRCSGERFDNGGVLYVSDTGVGVNLDTSDELFKPFIRRLEIPEERKALGLGGMGMGLAIVKMVADSIKCEVSFCRPMQGFKTTFKLQWEAV